VWDIVIAYKSLTGGLFCFLFFVVVVLFCFVFSNNQKVQFAAAQGPEWILYISFYTEKQWKWRKL